MLHPSVCLICVHCSNCSKNLFSMLKMQNMSRENFYEPKLSFPRPHNLSVPNRWEHQPHAILAVCKHCLISLKAFATWRRGSENSGQFGQLDVVVIQSARLGDSPLAASQDPAVATSEPQKCLCHQASNDRIQTTKYLMRDKHQCLRNIILLIISAFRSYIWCKRKDVQLTVVTVTPGNQHPFRGL